MGVPAGRGFNGRRSRPPHGRTGGLTARPGPGTIGSVFWPYRPRQGYPSAPAWLLLLALVLAVAVFIGVLVAIGGGFHEPDYGEGL